MPNFNAAEVRVAMLQVMSERSKSNRGEIQTQSVLQDVCNRLGIKISTENSTENEQAVLTLWYDLFRSGHVAFGYTIQNHNPAFCHLTQRGRVVLEHASRDPMNPDGYLSYLDTIAPIDQIARSYLDEALSTYNNNCFKAAAVMIGAATERIVLVLQATLVDGLTRKGQLISSGLKDWRYKTIRDAISKEMVRQRQKMPKDLGEAFDAYWTPLTEQPRVSRNDAGHPVSVDPVTPDTVHA